MRILLKVGLIGTFLSLAVHAQALDAAAQKKAEEASRSFLAMFDGGRYVDAWTKSASAAKKQVTKSVFVETVQFARNGHGKLQSREAKNHGFHEKLPRLPKGHYAIFQFDTKYAKTGDTTERVVLQLENGEWRLMGYFIFPPPA